MVWVIDPTAYRGDEMKDMVLENLSCSGSAASPESSFSYASCKQSSCVLLFELLFVFYIQLVGVHTVGFFPFKKSLHVCTEEALTALLKVKVAASHIDVISAAHTTKAIIKQSRASK
ncbi:unnamed protein product [Prunus armeniaca]|uniref:Uncharacterized protein n=1 Tax=Prunus armeniaca TaxID=36596 RepID=A0A6J5WLX4_PRUAR|nr:unnamed protein product [Prunus armeniaca]